MNARASMQRWLGRQALSPPVYFLLVVLAAVVCAAIYMPALDAARAADRTDGMTLLLAANPAAAVGVVLGLTGLAVLVAAAVTALGRPGAGLLAIAAGLAIVAASGGTIEQWLRTAGGTGVYWYFAAEMLAWAAIWLAIVLVLYHFNAILQQWAPQRVEGVAEGEAEVPQPAWWGAADALEGRSGPAAELSAAAVCIAVGLVGVAVLVQAPQWPQVLWGVFFSYLLAGLIAHQASPVRNPVPFVLSPLAAGFVSHAYIATQDADTETLLYNYFLGQYWSAGLVMPVYYASAGVAGAVLGRAWSQSWIRQHWLGE